MRAPYSRTLFELLCEQTAKAPERPAVIATDGCVKYAELEARVRRIAQGMREAGVSRGGRVGVLAGQRIQWLGGGFSAAAAGAPPGPLHPMASPRRPGL